MKVTRRQFLKVTGATAASFALVDLGFNLQATASAVKELRIKNVTPVPTVCPYCASGCGLVVYSEQGQTGKETEQKGHGVSPVGKAGKKIKSFYPGDVIFIFRNPLHYS
jgi:anaerobic selenocysteine-containing dehydrogenase